jgi:hypothetical protein
MVSENGVEEMQNKARHHRILLPCPQLNSRAQAAKHGNRLPRLQALPLHVKEVVKSVITENPGPRRDDLTNGWISRPTSPENRYVKSKPEKDAGEWKLTERAEKDLKNIFDGLDKDNDSQLSEKECSDGSRRLDDFLFDYGVTLDDVKDKRDLKKMTFEGLKAAVEEEWELSRKEQGLAPINVQRIVAKCIPGGNQLKPLAELDLMSQQEISDLCRTEIAPKLEEALLDYNKTRADSKTWGLRTYKEPEQMGNSKFALHKAVFGDIDEYHKGLVDTLGFPNIKPEEAIKHEHCNRDDSDQKFQPGNYQDVETTPRE